MERITAELVWHTFVRTLGDAESWNAVDMEITASILITLGALLGVLVTAITLPGTWLAMLVAAGVVLWRPDAMHWGYLIAGVVLAILAEVAEFFASAAGATQAGGSKAGAIGSIVGALIGAVVGTVLLAFLPIIGTIVGATIGAGAGALVAERGHGGRPWKESFTVGKGAAVGRLLSVVVKTAVAAVLCIVLIVGAWV